MNAMELKAPGILSLIESRGLTKSAIPSDILPMLATLVEKPEEQGNWLYEIKWDGFRCLGYKTETVCDLKSRNNKSFNEKFYPIYNVFKNLQLNVVLDGEIVVLNKEGLPDFEALQTWRSEADGFLCYYAFDILWWEGYSLMELPLSQRREILEAIVSEEGVIRLSKVFNASGSEFFATTSSLGLEGIIGKNAESTYRPDARSKDWVKIKAQKHQEVVIGGYTINENTPKSFSALLVGVYENGKLMPTTPVGTGFNNVLQKQIMEKLITLTTDQCPFAVMPEFNKPSRFRPNPPKAEVVWVKPELVAEIAYRTVSPDGAYRHPSFRGLREDKIAKDVHWEKVAKQDLITENKLVKNKVLSENIIQERKSLLNPTDESQVREIDGFSIKFSNLSKVFWPESGITKRDMLNYYYQVAPFMVPYLKDRPHTLNRFPNGINEKSFYQKDVTGKVPKWIKTHTYYSESDKREKHFMICDSEASLLYMANLGCIEINPWSSKTTDPDCPDWCVLDLDPDKNTFEQVIEAALVTKKVLDSFEVPSFCKTSGSTGLHIYIPLAGKFDYEDSKEFGRALMRKVHAEIPEFTSIERITRNRNGKMYLDFLQNRPQATVAAPYSLRPKPGATVSMPLHWDEVKKGLKMEDFNIHTAVPRLKVTGDLFYGVLGPGVNLTEIMKRIK